MYKDHNCGIYEIKLINNDLVIIFSYLDVIVIDNKKEEYTLLIRYS